MPEFQTNATCYRMEVVWIK